MTDDVMAGLRQRFRERALAEADQLEAALATGDRAAVERVAHSLAGTAGLFGHARIGAAAAELDRAFARGEADAAAGAAGLIEIIRQDLRPDHS